MAKFQDKKGANNIDQYNTGADRNKATIEAAIVAVDDILAIPDSDLQLLILDGATLFSDVTEYKDDKRVLRDQLVQQLRLFQLDTQLLEFDEIIKTYILFDPALGGAVQSVCGEEVGNEASGVLLNAGKWFHNTNESHEIILDLGNKEVIDGIAVDINAGSSDDHQLRGVDVHAAGTMAKIDNAENIMLTGVDFATVGSLNTHDFPADKKARFVKLTNITTDDANNKIKIKSIQVRVVPKFFQEE